MRKQDGEKEDAPKALSQTEQAPKGGMTSFDRIHGFANHIHPVVPVDLPSGVFGYTTCNPHLRLRNIQHIGNNFRLDFNIDQPIGYAVRNGGPEGQLDVANAASPVITRHNWQAVAADLEPNENWQGGNSPRVRFYNHALVERHEQFHVRDYIETVRRETDTVIQWMAGQDAKDADHCQDILRQGDMRMRINANRYFLSPAAEEVAYRDGVPAYRALVAKIRRRGRAGRYR
jgi:hypothetical protein